MTHRDGGRLHSTNARPRAPCYEETFLQSNVTKNEAKQFKAKTP